MVIAVGTLSVLLVEFGIMRSVQAASKGIEWISIDFRFFQVSNAVLYISNFL
ncbi:hypothetical protein ACEN2O_00415 [Flavobacterium sp. W21_SRS_FM7]